MLTTTTAIETNLLFFHKKGSMDQAAVAIKTMQGTQKNKKRISL